MLAARIEQPLFDLRHPVAEPNAVGGNQEVERRDDAGKPRARPAELTRLIDAGGDQHCGVALAKRGEGEVAADFGAEMEDHPRLFEQGDAAGNDRLVQLEIGDAVDEEPARPVGAVIDMHRVAFGAE